MNCLDNRADLVSELMQERLDLGLVSLVIDETLMDYYGYNLRYELKTVVKEVIFGKVRMAISVYEGVMDIFLINNETDELLVSIVVENDEGGFDFSQYYPEDIFLTVSEIEDRLKQGKDKEVGEVSNRVMPAFKLVATEVDGDNVEKLLKTMDKDDIKDKVKSVREKTKGSVSNTVINLSDYKT